MTLQEAIAKWLRAKKPGEGTEEVTEEASKKLPEAVMPRKAVEKKREQLKKLDEATKE